MSSKQSQIWYEHLFSNKIKLNQNQKSDIGTKNKNKLEHFDTEYLKNIKIKMAIIHISLNNLFTFEHCQEHLNITSEQGLLLIRIKSCVQHVDNHVALACHVKLNY